MTPEFQKACIVMGVRRLRVWAYENPKAVPAGKSVGFFITYGRIDIKFDALGKLLCFTI